MKDLKKVLGKCRDGFAALADALPYTRLDKDGTAIIGLRELCANGRKVGEAPGLFLKYEFGDYDFEEQTGFYGDADGQWRQRGWKKDMAGILRGEDASEVFTTVKELELLLRMAEYFDMRVEWVERLN